MSKYNNENNNMAGEKFKERVVWIDFLKGIIILLVVLGHVIGGAYNVRIFPEYRVKMSLIYNLIYLFHMPVFFIISGLCFRLAYTYKDEEGKIYLKGKEVKCQIFNLLYLYLFWSFLSWVFKIFASGQVNSETNVKEILFIPVKAVFQYWYLYALIVCYLLSILFHKILCNIMTGISLCMFLISIFSILYLNEEVTFVKGLEYYLFFYMGFCYFEMRRTVKQNKLILIIGGGAAICLNFLLIANRKTLTDWTDFGIAGILVASLDCFLIISLGSRFKKAGIFSYIGRSSLEIYVMHFLIISFNRIWLRRIDAGFYFYVVMNWGLGVIVPIIASYMLKKTKLYEFVFKLVKIKQK